MTRLNEDKLGTILWDIADELRGAMDADDFRDYMLSFIFLRYLSWNYEEAAQRELQEEYPGLPKTSTSEYIAPNEHSVAGEAGMTQGKTALAHWYDQNSEEDHALFEAQMLKKANYVMKPEHLWASIAEAARRADSDLLASLEGAFKFIEEKSFQTQFHGLFSEINLNSDKLGKTRSERNEKLCKIIYTIHSGLHKFSQDSDVLGDAYEYLIGKFASDSGKKAGEFYTPQQISSILSRIVSLDCNDPKNGVRKKFERVMDFACGSGSLLLNLRNELKKHNVDIGTMYAQEKNITTFNLARMNMLLHGVRVNRFSIHHGDSLRNDWGMLREASPSERFSCDAIVANPPFSYRWSPSDDLAEDSRFVNFGLAPRSTADFAFLLHGFHFLNNEGTMAIILPHGVLFRGGVEEKIRRKLLDNGNIDAIIGLPANLFYSTGIPVCIIVLKKCRNCEDILFINASEDYIKGKRQNYLVPEHIDRIVQTYIDRSNEKRFSRCVSTAEIQANNYNLNISRYVSRAEIEEEYDPRQVHAELMRIEASISGLRVGHNAQLEELGLAPLP